MTIRLRKWFSISDIPGSTNPNIKYGIYHRTIPGTNPPVIDSSDEGIDGKRYIVELIDSKVQALIAPCPEFCEGGEAASISRPITKRDLLTFKKRSRELGELMQHINNREELLKAIK